MMHQLGPARGGDQLYFAASASPAISSNVWRFNRSGNDGPSLLRSKRYRLHDHDPLFTDAFRPITQSSWQPRPHVPPPQIGLSAGHAVGAPQAGHRSAPGPQVSTLLPLHRCAPRSQTCGQLASGWTMVL
ncbi:MAG: hypothetical protein E6J91_51230 [Deltaproteobacteria bacterium]|nr:MAG: hypothetical protein E6J91_51230 [Deltaproteobacteria bacterium]